MRLQNTAFALGTALWLATALPVAAHAGTSSAVAAKSNATAAKSTRDAKPHKCGCAMKATKEHHVQKVKPASDRGAMPMEDHGMPEHSGGRGSY